MGKEKGNFMNSTVLHGDLRLDNLFFDFKPDGSLKRKDGSSPVGGD
jgi:hypothetical protein